MSQPELRLDPSIRLWVFLPIVAITFLVGIIRHYVTVLLSSDKKVELIVQLFIRPSVCLTVCVRACICPCLRVCSCVCVCCVRVCV